jgi:malate synthase
VCGLGLQVWQWVRHGARTKEGKQVTADWVARLLDEECDAIRR